MLFHTHLDLESPSVYYILYVDATPIGCAQIIDYGEATYELAYVYIIETYRSQSYGRDFVKFALYNHVAQKINILTIIPEFFEKLGAVRVPGYPVFVDHTCAECQACEPSKCTALVFTKPDWLHKFLPHSVAYDQYHELLKQENFLGSEFSIANELTWSYTENIYYTEIDGYIFFVIYPYGELPSAVIFPYRNVSCLAVNTFLERMTSLGIAELHYLTGIGKQRLAKYSCVYSFAFEKDRDNADYLYLVSEFAAFTGSAFEKKRNRLKKFLRQFPDHTLSAYAKAQNAEILQFAWNSFIHGLGIGVTSYEVLSRGLDSGLYHGFVVKIAEQIVGILLYSELNPQAVIVHFELIDTRYDGVAQYLNNELGKSLLGTYKYINREQDLGVEGLRKSKLSYNPYRILQKYTARFTRN